VRLKPYVELTLAVFLVYAAFSANAQTVPAAMDPLFPLAAGAGISGFEPDINAGRIYGGTLWIDYSPNWFHRFCRGSVWKLCRDISLGRSASQPPNLREDTVEGGVFYSWRHFRSFRPYIRGAGGYGNADYEGSKSVRHSESRTISAVGGGVEFRVTRRIWVRADYEYQIWPAFFKTSTIRPDYPTSRPGSSIPKASPSARSITSADPISDESQGGCITGGAFGIFVKRSQP